MSKYTTKQIKDIVHEDSVSKYKGVYTVRRGFFYRHGWDSKRFGDYMSKQLTEAGVQFEEVDRYEQWKPFRGGDTVAQGSHFGFKFRIIED